MQSRALALAVLLGAAALAGCATAYGRGVSALGLGRYDEAADRFAEALAEAPARLDALAGLGIARYKLGAWDAATDALQRVVAREPDRAEARLYLGLSHLRKGEDGPAEEQLRALLGLKPHPRIAAQINRALSVIRGDVLSDELRRFLAASLEDEADWERELREARLEQRLRVDPFWPRGILHCFSTRHGRLICL
ncbi:MAG: tetratricopeptide repeat protein [Candidatus Rokubacteria bacterium]|nr:tetratricopeptide repeat protein [Candidatus Rokubacteria bacterium]